ncbi:protein kinase [candidate division KSB1 bacterium]|nr:protein kinase [candidate division KSB1 bacterium]
MLNKIVDKFRIDAVLGEGGMGIVYRAWDMVLERHVALKMIHRQFTPTEISFRRFLAEAKILAKLEHPNIVQVYDLLEHEGSWFIVMQYVEGLTLAKIIEREGPMPYQRFSPVCKQVLAALGYAHRAGVIHRDIKPSNVILAREGTVKVTDFGLAKYEHHPALTQTSSTGGTLYYMSPEQVKNLANVDQRSDLYAIGMMFYEMLTGRTPFPPGAPPIDIMNAILDQPFQSPRRLLASVPEPLSEIVMKALAKDPAQRHQSADEMLNAITQFEYQVNYATTVRFRTNDAFDVSRYDISPQGPLSSRQAAYDESGRLPAKYGPPATSLPDTSGRGKFKRLVPGFLAITAAVLLILLTLKVWQRSPEMLESVLQRPVRAPERPAAHPLARLSIFTEPANATVFLNGDSIGLTPVMAYSIKPGKLALRIQRQNYLPIEVTATVTAGKDTTFYFPLAALKADTPKTLMVESETLKQTLPRPPVSPPAVGAVRIDSSPRDATIIFDGRTWGTTPRTIQEVTAGDHGIVLSKTGYREAYLSVTIASGKTQEINATLLPLMGKLRVIVMPSGAIFIDGEQKRPNAADPYETSLPVGSYRIRMESPQLGFLEKTIDIKADRPHELAIDFTRMVKLIVTAFDTAGQRVRAEVFVDGKRIGETLQELHVRIGQHEIEVRREGYKLIGNPQEIQLEESTAQPVRMRFTLRKIQ